MMEEEKRRRKEERAEYELVAYEICYLFVLCSNLSSFYQRNNNEENQ